MHGDTAAAVHVCSNGLATPTDLPWANGFTYTPPNLTVNNQGGIVSTTNPDVNYQAAPEFYIERLGVGPDGVSQYYQVTAGGFGGSVDTKSVVRSTYAITPAVRNLDGL
jgi:Tfp pilus assembly protein PilX